MSEIKVCSWIFLLHLSFLLSAFCLLLSIRLTSLLHLLMSENKDCYRIVRVGLSFLLSAFRLLLASQLTSLLHSLLLLHQACHRVVHKAVLPAFFVLRPAFPSPHVPPPLADLRYQG